MEAKLNKIKNSFDISIGQFQEYQALENPTKFDVVRIFYNIKEETAKQIVAKDINKLCDHVEKAINKEPEFKLKYKGLGFEPDLENMSAGAFYDAINYAQAIETAHLFTAVMYRPTKKGLKHLFGKKYQIKEYKGTSGMEEKAKDLPLGLYMGMTAFFLTLLKDLTSVIRSRFQAKSKQLNHNLNQKDYKETGETLYHFMQSLEEIISNSSIKFQMNPYQK